ncbi:MAG: glutamate-1-semialdehyde 2,1-aminomutase [Sphingobacteriales bacterium]|nr:glutamate-1-semialdehyde 2,1-aminomutase [Sphingobacteriales bacterium]
MNITQSEQLFQRAKQLMPGGVNSPVRAFKSVGGTPVYMERGEGCYMHDVDGNRYIDFCCSWGPLILGHRPPQVMEKIQEALSKGTTFGTVNPYEVALAELLVTHHRCVERVRFVSSGTEAVMSAVRLARGFTQRDKIIKFEGCYHGHVDYLMVKAGSGLVTFGESSSAGVPEVFAAQTIVLPLNDLDALEQTMQRIGNEIAAILIEPIPANNGLLLQDKTFLQALRRLCTQYGSLLIFDEVISGFRVGFEGAAAHYNITPDLLTFGKIIGGGMPVGAFGGRADIMKLIAPEGAVYQAGTLSGNPVAMAAGWAQLQACLQEGFYEELHKKTAFFCDIINTHCRQKGYPAHLFHIDSIFWIAFTSADHIADAHSIDADKMVYFKRLYPLLLERGIYLGPSGYEVGFVSQAHSYDVLQTAAQVLCDCLDIVFSS